MKKLMSAAVALSLCAVVLTGCYGPFKLTQKLHQWNGSMGSKWASEAVFLVFTILPVYSLAVLGDAVIFNSVEFWTGSNPISSTKPSRIFAQGDKQTVVTYSAVDQKMRVDLFQNYRPAGFFTVESVDGKTVARSSSGALMGSVDTFADGSMAVRPVTAQ